MENLTETFKLHSESISEIATALSNAAIHFKPAIKVSKVDMTLKSGRQVKYNYADLQEIVNAIGIQNLADNGLSVSQLSTSDGRMHFVITLLMHESGQWLKSYYPVISESINPQAVGAAFTYARRYSLAAICNIITEDDDGESAMNRERDPLQKPIAKPIQTRKLTDKELLIDQMNKAGDLLELQGIVANAPAEFKNEKFNEYVKTLEQKFALKMTKEVFDIEPEEIKPTFEEIATKHSKISKPKGAR